MLYITQAHKAKCKAKVAAEKLNTAQAHGDLDTGDVAMKLGSVLSKAANQKDVILASLAQDREALKQHSDVKKKVELKKEHLVPKWLPIIEQYRDSGAHHPFEPLVWFVIWLFDAQEFEQGIYWADFAIKQNQKMPDGFRSANLESVVTRQLHDWALEQFKAQHSAEPYLTSVLERIESNQWLVGESALLSMLFKLVALYAEHENQNEKAETYFLKAVEANPEKHGVKGSLHRVQKKLNKELTQL